MIIVDLQMMDKLVFDTLSLLYKLFIYTTLSFRDDQFYSFGIHWVHCASALQVLITTSTHQLALRGAFNSQQGEQQHLWRSGTSRPPRRDAW